jgi:hypothetical protein
MIGVKAMRDMEGKHYGQILVNYTVKDGTEKKYTDDLAETIKKFVEDTVDTEIIKDIDVRVNL